MVLDPKQSIFQRQQIIEDALAEALNIDILVMVETDECVRYLSVPDPSSETRQLYCLADIARRLEILLS